MTRRVPYAMWVAAVLGGALSARATILDGVQPAALDQPQINMIVYLGVNTVPQIGMTQDPLGGLLGLRAGVPGNAEFGRAFLYLGERLGELGVGIVDAPEAAVELTVDCRPAPETRPVWAGGTVGRVLFSSARGLLADWVSAVIRKLPARHPSTDERPRGGRAGPCGGRRRGVP